MISASAVWRVRLAATGRTAAGRAVRSQQANVIVTPRLQVVIGQGLRFGLVSGALGLPPQQGRDLRADQKLGRCIQQRSCAFSIGTTGPADSL